MLPWSLRRRGLAAPVVAGRVARWPMAWLGAWSIRAKPVSGDPCALFWSAGASIVDPFRRLECPAALEAQVAGVHSVPLVARLVGYRPRPTLTPSPPPPIWDGVLRRDRGRHPVRSGHARMRPVCGLALSATGALLPYFEPGTLAMFLTPERGAAFNCSWNVGGRGLGAAPPCGG